MSAIDFAVTKKTPYLAPWIPLEEAYDKAAETLQHVMDGLDCLDLSDVRKELPAEDDLTDIYNDLEEVMLGLTSKTPVEETREALKTILRQIIDAEERMAQSAELALEAINKAQEIIDNLLGEK